MKQNHERQFLGKPYVPSEITLAQIGAIVDDSVRRATVRGSSVTPYTDSDFAQDMAQVQDDFNDQVNGLRPKLGHSPPALQQASRALQKVATRKRAELQQRKTANDRMYELRRQDIVDNYEDKIVAKRHEINEHGLAYFGIGQQEIAKVEAKREREIEKLKIEFGKD